MKITTASGSVTFHDYGVPITVQEPPGDQVVSIDDLKKASGS